VDVKELLNQLVPVVALVLGFYLKSRPWYNTKFIPLASFAVSLIIRLASGLGVEPASAHELQLASLFAFSWGSLWVVARALLDAFIATGVQSSVKNVAQGIQKAA